ncbi:unnamed protein product [Ectocarpus fasciculatus]
MSNTAAVSLAALSVVLGLTPTPCSGGTSLRGSPMSITPDAVAERRKVSYADRGPDSIIGGYQHLEVHPAATRKESKKNGGSKRAKKSKESKKTGERAKKSRKSKVRVNKAGGRRLLQASPDPALPACASLFVPTGAGDELTGTYEFQGRYSHQRPVYAAENGNRFFATKDEGAMPITWYVIQPEESNSKYFLSLESDVFEPNDLELLQPWVRNNDPTCTSCISKLRMSCSDSTAAPTAAPPTTTPAPTDPVPSHAGNENSTMSTAAETVVPPATTPAPAPIDIPSDMTMVDTSAVGGCANLKIDNGEDRAGVYSLSGVDGEGGVVFRNGRPSYAAVGDKRTDVVFSTTMNVCAAGYGVVDADWATRVGHLPPSATVNDVFLMYVAENVGVDTADDAAAAVATAAIASDNDDCEVPVWLLVADGAESLDDAGENTFLSVSGVDDPSEATSWAKFTPATDTTRPTLVENFWIDVGCANAGEVEEASAAADTGDGGEEEQVTAGLSDNSTALVPVGSEPNARRLSTMFAW